MVLVCVRIFYAIFIRILAIKIGFILMNELLCNNRNLTNNSFCFYVGGTATVVADLSDMNTKKC